MPPEETVTNTKPQKSNGSLLAEAFLAGFASTVGMMAAFAAYQNRYRIREFVKQSALAIGQSI